MWHPVGGPSKDRTLSNQADSHSSPAATHIGAESALQQSSIIVMFIHHLMSGLKMILGNPSGVSLRCTSAKDPAGSDPNTRMQRRHSWEAGGSPHLEHEACEHYLAEQGCVCLLKPLVHLQPSIKCLLIDDHQHNIMIAIPASWHHCIVSMCIPNAAAKTFHSWQTRSLIP